MYKAASSLLCAGLILGIAGCSTAPKSEADKDALRDEAKLASTKMTNNYPGLDKVLSDAHGYAIFPEIGKGGFVVGGSYGRGIVHEKGKFIGYADITKVSVGLQIGGQTFREVVVFQDEAAMNRFKGGKVKFDANASAVILKSGAAAAAKYQDGVAVFVEPIGGAMAEASLGVQEFGYTPAGDANGK